MSEPLEDLRSDLERALKRHRKRTTRKLRAIEADAARAAKAPVLRQHADLVMSHLHALDGKATRAQLLDYHQDPPAEVELSFDPQLGPRGQAEAWYRDARRFEQGARIATRRADETRQLLEKLQRLADQVAATEDRAALCALREEAVAMGAATKQVTPPRGGKTIERLPYREFRSGQLPIWVGRGPKDNDALTLHHARPHHLWLHTRDVPGAHVVVPLGRGKSCPPEVLIDAALLALHFSKAKGQTRADVIHVERRHIRKPRGSAAGVVLCGREKVLHLVMDGTRLQALLDSEIKLARAQ